MKGVGILDIEQYRRLCTDSTISITKHAQKRFWERGICLDDILTGIGQGRIIKEYPDDTPFPSCLICGFSTQHKPIHIVASTDGEYLYIITAYYPSTDIWDETFSRRKE